MLANAKDKDSILYDRIKDTIRGLTLFSEELTGAFKDKEYVLHTLKALSVLDVTKQMEDEMRIDVEEWMKKPAGKRGARLDALISFKSHRINIEIQRLKRGDEIQRASFYMAKNISEVDEGERLCLTIYFRLATGCTKR